MLIGIGKLCNIHCKVTFTEDDVPFYDKRDNPILKGWCKRSGTEMWRFALRQDAQENYAEAKEMTFRAFSAYELPIV